MSHKLGFRPVLVSMLAFFLVASSLTMVAAQTNATIKEGYSYTRGQLESFTAPVKGQVFMHKKAIAKLYQNEETIESFSAPQDPTNPDVVYFSTSSGTDLNKSKNKIYFYNTKTGKLKNIYQEKAPRLLRTLGIDGTKLIVMYDVIDNSPGPCFSIWADWTDFGYLDVVNTSGKLKPYTVPQYKVEEGKAEQKKCQKEMGI